MNYHYISIPKEGEHYSGDGVFIHEKIPFTRFITVDSLGHGEKAEKVINEVNEVNDRLSDKSPSKIINFLHRILRGTRGGAVSIADFYENRLYWCGVGNVDMRCTNKNINPVNISGIVGYKVRKTKTFDYNFEEGDIFLIHTDGISSRFSLDDLPKQKSAKDIAEYVMKHHRKPMDDSTVLVVKI